MIKWRDVLYLDEITGTAGNKEKILAYMAEGRFFPMPVFGIFLAQNEENLLEIISLNEFLQPGYDDTRTFFGVGMAIDRYSAVDMVQKILMEVYQATGDVRVREYLYPDGGGA